MAEKSTGQWVGTIVGAVVGYFTFGTGYIAMGAALGGAVGGAIDPPKGPKISGPRLGDLSAQTASYGTTIPLTYGTIALHGNVFWIENNSLREQKHTEGGGKGGGGGAESTTYSYYATFALGLCQGPIQGIKRIWIGGKLFYDAGSTDPETIAASNQAKHYFTLYTGSETQLPDDRMQAAIGIADCPAYRGLAYLVFKDLPLADYGNTLLGANVKVEVSGSISQQFDPAFAIDTMVSAPYGGVSYADGTINIMRHGLVIGMYGWVDGYKRTSYTIDGRKIEDVQYSLPGRSGHYIYPVSNTADEFVIGLATSQLMRGGVEVADLYFGTSPVFLQFRSNIVKTVEGDYVAVRFNSLEVTVYLERYVVAGDKMRPWSANYEFSTLDSNSEVVIALSRDGSRIVVSCFAGMTYAPAGVTPVHCVVLDTLTLTVLSYQTTHGELIGVGSQLIYFGGSGSITTRLLDGLAPGPSYPASFAATVDFRTNAVIDDMVVLYRGNVYMLHDVVSANAPTLSAVVNDLCIRSGLLESSDIDSASLTSLVDGYRIASVAAIRSAIDPLRSAYLFDVIQHGYVVRFVPRGAASVASITESELGATVSGSKPGVRLTRSREMAAQIPASLSVQYLDASREYDMGEQHFQRAGAITVDTEVIEMPLVLSNDVAAGLAEMLLYLYWLERHDASFILPPSYGHLEPADVITVSARNGIHRFRLASVQYLPDGRIECEAKLDSDSLYTPIAIGEAGAGGGSALTLAGPSKMVLLDIPAVLPDLDIPGFVAGVSGVLGGWKGAVVFRSDDAWQTYSQILAVRPPGATMGVASNAIPAPATVGVIDKSSELVVWLYAGELASVSEISMFNGLNHFAYGAPGRWEIIAAQDCVQKPDGSWSISNLLRGRFGTEHATASHVAGDLVVALSASSLDFVNVGLNSVGLERLYRCVTSGSFIDSASDVSMTYQAVNLKCLSPVYLNGRRSPGVLDWQLYWIRRTRVGGEWANLVDAAIGEATESYEVDIFSAADFLTLKRTLTGVTVMNTYYTAAQQTADFGALQSTLHVCIYQISATTGRGYPLQQSITR